MMQFVAPTALADVSTLSVMLSAVTLCGMVMLHPRQAGSVRL
jgi:hypothetical protein